MKIGSGFAWAGLARVGELGRLEVVVQARSALWPAGWDGVLRIDDTVTVAVPDAGLVARLSAVLGALSAVDATNPVVVRSRLPGVSEVLGPAALFYAQGLVVGPTVDTVVASLADLDDLLNSVSAADLDESGLWRGHLPAVRRHRRARNTGRGLRISTVARGPRPPVRLTHAEHRRQGWGRAVAAAAIAHAIGEGLLPQWRARPEPSQALARSLRLTERGAQLSLRLGDAGMRRGTPPAAIG